jgi:hypothetical protein
MYIFLNAMLANTRKAEVLTSQLTFLIILKTKQPLLNE